jgi:hypothetical protein
MPKPLHCETVISDAVLQAARNAIPADPSRWVNLPPVGVRNQPLLPLLVALIDATRCTAAAVADNAWDDCHPLPYSLAEELAKTLRSTADDLINATQCPDSSGWSLPSFSGKELV